MSNGRRRSVYKVSLYAYLKRIFMNFSGLYIRLIP